ncbi:MAG TPA: type II toxin-antitoxin system PemK/MazF family toxin [Pyrinomonadaceae bacterium]|nr:type II toxin-antitoxin system PemK/MazF family toxin [Pyrinomonadaceae bacterium]
MVNRFDLYLVSLDDEPTPDPKITRPAVIISPDEMNRYLETVIVAPLSTTTCRLPTRISTNFLNSERSIILDQIRTVDKKRLVKKIGELSDSARQDVTKCLLEMFAL